MNTLKLKAKIMENGLNLGKIADILGINPATLTAKLSGKTSFNLVELRTLKSVLDLSMEEMNDIFFCS